MDDMLTGFPNRSAFLDTIAYSEGTTKYIDSDNGYNVIVGGTLFHNYADHPRVRVYIPKINNYSTAAGRYQLLEHWFDAYKIILKLPDFSPPSQDAVALRQIKERNALASIDAGAFGDAITKCSNIWASFPGNNYGQHENSMLNLQQFYCDAGGSISATGSV